MGLPVSSWSFATECCGLKETLLFGPGLFAEPGGLYAVLILNGRRRGLTLENKTQSNNN